MLHIPGFLKFCSSRNLTSGRNNSERNGQLLLETMRFWWSPTVRQSKLAARRMWAQKKLKLLHVAWQWSYYSLLFPCSSSYAESFVICLRNKAYVYFTLLVLLFVVTANAEMPVEAEGLHLIGCFTYEWDFTDGAIVQFQAQTLREIGRLYGEYGTRPLYTQYITRLTQRTFPLTASWGSLPIYVNDLKGSWKRSFSPFLVKRCQSRLISMVS